MTEGKVPSYKNCFVCGRDNPYGLKLDLEIRGDKIEGEIVLDNHYQGYRNMVHGGILCAILDEAMVWAPKLSREQWCATGEMTVRFVKPARLGEKLSITAWLEKDATRICYTAGEIRNEEGQLVATSTGKYVPVNEAQQKELEEWLDK